MTSICYYLRGTQTQYKKTHVKIYSAYDFLYVILNILEFTTSKRRTLGYQEVAVEQDGFLKCPFCEEVFAHLADFVGHTNESHEKDIGRWTTCQRCRLHLPNSALLVKVIFNLLSICVNSSKIPHFFLIHRQYANIWYSWFSVTRCWNKK